MKKLFIIPITLLIIVGCAKKPELITPEISAKVKVSAETLPADNDAYLTDNILSSVKDISISNLLNIRKISVAINDDFGCLGFEEESNKMANSFGNNRSMLLANHGI